jgi:hypothetical protein
MNQVDKLFSEKLAEHATMPSNRANELFLSRLEQKKKTVFWTSSKRYFAAAASVMLVAGIGYLNMNKTEVSSPQVATNSAVPKLNTLKTNVEPVESGKNNIVANEQNAEIKTQVKTVFSPINSFVATNQLSTQKTVNIDDKLKSFTPDESNDYLNNKNTTVAIAKPDTRPIETVLDPTSDENKNADDTFIIISPMTEAYVGVDMTDIPSILDLPSLDNALLVEDQEERLLTKIYDEVKGLKKGQHLDFNKFGFKSLEEMALNDQGFIVSKAREIKSKLQWIKSKINN